MADAKTMNASGMSGSSRIDLNPTVSSVESLGLDSRYSKGTNGNGEPTDFGSFERGDFPNAKSSQNPGGHDYNSGGKGGDVYDATRGLIDPSNVAGTQGSRDNMDNTNLGSGKGNTGKLYGKGAGSIPASKTDQTPKGYYSNYADGTNTSRKQMEVSQRGISGGAAKRKQA